MAALQLLDKLLQFPLFLGMSRDDLEIVAGHTRFGFLKLEAGKTVVKSGDNCNQLHFLINGNLRVRTYSDDYGYSVEEQMQAPNILQLESVFGYYQRYTHDFIAQTDVNFITINKEEVMRLTEDFLVFRLNIMNHFATLTDFCRIGIAVLIDDKQRKVTTCARVQESSGPNLPVGFPFLSVYPVVRPMATAHFTAS